MVDLKTLQPVRGTRDIIGEDSRRHFHVIGMARDIAARYGCTEWVTPIFEDTSVFARTLGETSDVVTKEMYSFTDRGGESITLRPENTAGICRALVSNGLTQSLPQKVFYAGPMFRYERPQKGRYRQFHQIGMEIIGSAEPLADAEAIDCGWQILRALGISQHVTLKLNTLGDTASRDAYRAALVAYFSRFEADLSADSQMRLVKNPLRILDSKDENDRRLVAGAPTIFDYLTPDAARFFDGVQNALTIFGVPFIRDPQIVRGLDYYSHTAFEFTTDALGAQGTVLGGGRYDGLLEQMGGPAMPAIGWAAGIERLAMLIAEPPAIENAIAIIPVNDVMQNHALQILADLRASGMHAEISYRGNMKRRMERANRIQAAFAVIVGDAEFERGVVQVKNLRDGQQIEQPIAGLADYFR
ncbi:MAG: histidine--tRNA ligase [Rhodospirillales bacterium 20-60-12]|nr:MAG: histidine--tRNA ligase [Rhodospirillales bacterium 20-60-12]HQT67354.1 histidine--tRNA ligase [Acetobacteraceae bacterium]